MLVNGVPSGYFSSSRGVRQGQWHLFFFFFSLQKRSRGISKLVSDRKISPISSPRGSLAPTHLLYADDILVFCKGTASSLQNLMDFFEAYGQAAGQVINKSKKVQGFHRQRCSSS